MLRSRVQNYELLLRCCVCVSSYSGTSVEFLDHFESGTHNATWTCYGYYESINRFIGTVSCVVINMQFIVVCDYSNYFMLQVFFLYRWSTWRGCLMEGSHLHYTNRLVATLTTPNMAVVNAVNTTGCSIAEVWICEPTGCVTCCV